MSGSQYIKNMVLSFARSRDLAFITLEETMFRHNIVKTRARGMHYDESQLAHLVASPHDLLIFDHQNITVDEYPMVYNAGVLLGYVCCDVSGGYGY
jgi:hypothetical protein